MYAIPSHLLWIFGPTATLYDADGGAQSLAPNKLAERLKDLRSRSLVVVFDTTLIRLEMRQIPPVGRRAIRHLLHRYLEAAGPLWAYDTGAAMGQGPLERPLLVVPQTPLTDAWMDALMAKPSRIHTWTTAPLALGSALTETPGTVLTVLRPEDSRDITQIALYQNHCWLLRTHPYVEYTVEGDIAASLTHLKSLGIFTEKSTLCLAGAFPSFGGSMQFSAHEEAPVKGPPTRLAWAQHIREAAGRRAIPTLHVPVFARYHAYKKSLWVGGIATFLCVAGALFLTTMRPEIAPAQDLTLEALETEISDLKTQLAAQGIDPEFPGAEKPSSSAGALQAWREAPAQQAISPTQLQRHILAALPQRICLMHLSFTTPTQTSPAVIVHLETYHTPADADPMAADADFDLFLNQLSEQFPGAQVDRLRTPSDGAPETPHCPGSVALFIPGEGAP